MSNLECPNCHKRIDFIEPVPREIMRCHHCGMPFALEKRQVTQLMAVPLDGINTRVLWIKYDGNRNTLPHGNAIVALARGGWWDRRLFSNDFDGYHWVGCEGVKIPVTKGDLWAYITPPRPTE